MTGTGDFRRLRLEGGGEALVRQQRWVDPPGEVSQILERFVRSPWSVAMSSRGLGRIALGELLGEAQLHRERHELLLDAVVDVALELAAFVVLGRHQPLT